MALASAGPAGQMIVVDHDVLFVRKGLMPHARRALERMRTLSLDHCASGDDAVAGSGTYRCVDGCERWVPASRAQDFERVCRLLRAFSN